MKYLLFSLSLLLLIGCNTNHSESNKDLAMLDKSEMVIDHKKDYTYYYDTITTDEYQIKLGVNELRGNKAELVISMELFNQSFFVSPNAKRDFKGKFTFTLPESEHVTLAEDIREVPLSVEEIDEHPFVNGPVNWVREDTKYFQKVIVNTEEDFYLIGELKFVIEPKCTLEEFRLSIRQEGGYFKIMEQPKGC